jgi:hypothetical protein
MKPDAIAFVRDTVTIRHTLTAINLEGKHIIVAEDQTKSKPSTRALPPVPFLKEQLGCSSSQRRYYLWTYGLKF